MGRFALPPVGCFPIYKIGVETESTWTASHIWNRSPIQLHETSTWLLDDYHVARPHGILVVTSTHGTVIALPRRLSAWDDSQCNDASWPPLHADKRPVVAFLTHCCSWSGCG